MKINNIDLLNDIDWKGFWEISKEYIFPNTGTLILNIVLFCILAICIAITYTVILYRKKVFKRIPRYYNWAVKLYIPLLFIGIIYVFLQMGVVRGIYKILDDSRPHIVAGIYEVTLDQIFQSNAEKDIFINKIKLVAKETQEGSEYFSSYLSVYIKEYVHTQDSGNNIVDKAKNKLVDYLVNRYSDDIYAIAIYGMLNATPHVDIGESISYEEFHVAFDALLHVDYEKLEESIVNKIDKWCDGLLYSQYKSLMISNLILLLIIMIFPLIEFFIYKKWIEKPSPATLN